MTDTKDEPSALAGLVNTVDEYLRAQEAYMRAQIEVNKLPSDRVNWDVFLGVQEDFEGARSKLRKALENAREQL